MSIKKVTMYTVSCDRCGKEAFKSNRISAWHDAPIAEAIARDDFGWIEVDSKHYCPGCTKWNKDETELIPENG